MVTEVPEDFSRRASSAGSGDGAGTDNDLAATYDGSTGTGYDRTVTWLNVPAGAIMPMQILQVASGTNLLALY